MLSYSAQCDYDHQQDGGGENGKVLEGIVVLEDHRISERLQDTTTQGPRREHSDQCHDKGQAADRSANAACGTKLPGGQPDCEEQDQHGHQPFAQQRA